jgi:hypothetical protein
VGGIRGVPVEGKDVFSALVDNGVKKKLKKVKKYFVFVKKSIIL